jgi:hypothetical protein
VRKRLRVSLAAGLPRARARKQQQRENVVWGGTGRGTLGFVPAMAASDASVSSANTSPLGHCVVVVVVGVGSDGRGRRRQRGRGSSSGGDGWQAREGGARNLVLGHVDGAHEQRLVLGAELVLLEGAQQRAERLRATRERDARKGCEAGDARAVAPPTACACYIPAGRRTPRPRPPCPPPPPASPWPGSSSRWRPRATARRAASAAR